MVLAMLRLPIILYNVIGSRNKGVNESQYTTSLSSCKYMYIRVGTAVVQFHFFNPIRKERKNLKNCYITVLRGVNFFRVIFTLGLVGVRNKLE